MVPLRSLRILIESGAWPADEGEDRRLALRACGRISDPGRQAELYDRLVNDLTMLALEHARGGGGIDARRAALGTLAEIEAASRPN